MSSADEEFRRGEKDDQQNPKPASELWREAFTQITRGIRQLFTAMATERAGVMRHIAPIGRTFLTLAKVAAFTAVLIFLALATTMLWVLYDVPLKTAGMDGPSALVEAADGQPLGRVGPLGDAVERKDFPDYLVNAVISIEDRRFLSHRGVDLRGILRATYANWSAGGIVEGGSTITQQRAKMQIVGAERSMSRKLREAFIATWLELRLEKDEILTRYLNTVYLGAGGHGMSAAAPHVFR